MLDEIMAFVKKDCLFTDQMVERIYEVGTYYGLFSGNNSGFDDRQNSVYCFMDTLRALNKKES